MTTHNNLRSRPASYADVRFRGTDKHGGYSQCLVYLDDQVH